jgi:hypothetical protein
MMKARGVLALCMGAALVAGACGGAEDDSTLEPMPDSAPMTEPAPASDPAQLSRGYEQVISGNLGKVDPDASTFTLDAGNREQSFRFNAATQVTGASGTQGLAGREGARVTVHYREEAGAMLATRIVIDDAAPAAPAR